MITYKIKEGTEDVIIKSGQDIEFPFSDIDKDTEYLKKVKKEIEGNIGIQTATMKNVERSHPHVANMTKEDLTAAYLYRQATGYLSEAEKKLAEINKQLEDYADEKVEIINQTSIKSPFMNTEETPVVPAEEAVVEAPVAVEPEAPVEAPVVEEPTA
jgi:hypothetical protein